MFGGRWWRGAWTRLGRSPSEHCLWDSVESRTEHRDLSACLHICQIFWKLTLILWTRWPVVGPWNRLDFRVSPAHLEIVLLLWRFSDSPRLISWVNNKHTVERESPFCRCLFEVFVSWSHPSPPWSNNLNWDRSYFCGIHSPQPAGWAGIVMSLDLIFYIIIYIIYQLFWKSSGLKSSYFQRDVFKVRQPPHDWTLREQVKKE